MTEKQLKGYVLRLFKFKSISPKQFMIALNNLEQLKESNPFFYYFNMGKLQTAFGNAEEAIFYLEKAIELKPDNASAYYNLYKCYVKKGNVDLAYECINESLKYNKNFVDFTFTMQIMKNIKLLDIDYLTYLNLKTNVPEDTKVGYNDLSNNETLSQLYKSVIQSFNDKDYVMCLKKLSVMDTIINKLNYPMEVNTLISLVKILKNKEISKCQDALSDNSMETSSNDNFCVFQMRLFELGCYNPESYLRMVEEVINDDVLRAKKLLDAACENPKFSSYLDVIEYLNGFIREKCAFMLLTKEKQEEFTSRRLNAKSLYKNKHNDKSLEEYSSLKEEFNLPICDYYIGKILFRKGEFSQAMEAFLSYLEQGGDKAEKAYMFLGKIEKIQKNNNQAKRYIDRMHRIHKIFIRDFDYLSNKKKKDKDDLYDQHDDVKRKKSSIIRMSEADFIGNDFVEFGDFYDVGIDGKLGIIRNLLQTGNEKLANKLYEEVQRECAKEERGKVKQFERNRKIYRNQNRTFSS